MKFVMIAAASVASSILVVPTVTQGEDRNGATRQVELAVTASVEKTRA